MVRRRDEDRALAGELSELERAAGQALVRTDERISLADDELGFAVADFGEDAIAEFAPALDRARQRLGEAFHLNQLLSDHVTDTPERRRELNQRIISLCHSAEAVVSEQHSALSARRTAARRTPSDVEKVRTHIRRVREASTAVRAGAETVQRAEALLAAVSGFEVEALQAESTLTAMVAGSNVELSEARSLPQPDDVDGSMRRSPRSNSL